MLLNPIAKINIGLHVVERRADGYHNLETVFYPIPLQDNLELKPLRYSSAPWALQVAGHAVAGKAEENLVVRAFEALRADYPLPPTDIYLYKRIPMGAGLGGGSSDAAEMVKGLNQLYGLGLTETEMERRVARLGADCAFFVRGKAAYATGIGDILTPVSVQLKGWTLVLVKPADHVPTRDAYAGIVPHQPACDLREAVSQSVETWRETVRNDFEDVVFPKYPRIAAIKETLYTMGAAYASMSGSGSAVFGLFRHHVDEAQSVFSDCFVFQSLLRQ